MLPGHRHRLRLCYSSSFCQQCVPYLIAIGTDEEQQMRVKSDQQLSEIDSKYSMFVQVSKIKLCNIPAVTTSLSMSSYIMVRGVIVNRLLLFQMKALAGIKMSFELQRLVQKVYLC